MAGGLTTDQLLAELHMQPANRETQVLAHHFAASLIGELPPCDRAMVGEVLLRVSSDVDGFVRVFASQGMDLAKSVSVVVKMLAVAGAELHTEGMSAEDVAARVLGAIQEAL
jgi:hypothetical protein